MTPVIVVSRANTPAGGWSDWHPAWLLSDHTNTWHVWSWRYPFGRWIHKRSLGLWVEAR